MTVVGLIAGRGVRELARGGVLIGVVLLVFAINLTPSLVYWAKHGRNVPAERTLQENERLTLRLTDMVLPVSNHRIDALADLKHEYEGSTLFQERAESKQQALGVFGVLGFGFVVAAALAAAVRRRGSVPPLAAAAGVVALIAFAIGTAGGLSSLAALLLTEGIRSWARIGMYVAFVALLGFGILLDALRARLGGIRGGGALFIAVLVVALVVGVLDETTNERVPAYTAVAADFRDDDAFVSRVEDRLPDGAMVYQLPYLPFPEAGLQPPPSRMEDYDPLRGYLHSHDLRWSYGAMKGRPSDWAGLVAAEPVPLLTAAVASAGFDGIEIDRFGYGDNGADLEARLGATLDVEPIVSENGRLSFFDLRPYTARLRSTLPERTLADLRALTLKPLQLEWPIFSATLATRQGAPAGVLITWPDGSSQRVNVSSAGAFVRRRIRIPPAKSTLAFASDAQPGLPSTADPRTLYLAFIDARLVDVELLGMQRRFTARRLP